MRAIQNRHSSQGITQVSLFVLARTLVCLFFEEDLTVKTLKQERTLVIGWKAVGDAVGRTADYLIQAHAKGRLPVPPIKVGAQVAYSADMVDALRAALESRDKIHQRKLKQTGRATPASRGGALHD
jgi:hypothetical protein